MAIDIKKYKKIFLEKDWPIKIRPYIDKYFFGIKNREDPDDEIRQSWIELVKDLYSKDQIYISESGPNDDRNRKIINKIVIHHSGTSKKHTNNNELIEYINALHLLRLYAYYFSTDGELEYGHSMYSGHFFMNKQTFICYHWIVCPDGEPIQINEDESVVWHAVGANNDSISICAAGDYSDKDSGPNDKQIDSINEIINNYRKKYPKINVFGHREVSQNRKCPGDGFLGANGWKKKLLL